MNDRSGPLKICVLGASLDTGNLGVSALCLSMLRGVSQREPGADVTVFDHGLGSGPADARFEGGDFRYRRCGLRHSRRIYLPESLWRIGTSLRFGTGGNPSAAALRSADAVLDITGGDSFTDLYGTRRFRGGCAAKRLALEHSGGLIFMPQTYGPFREESTRREAARLVAAAAAAWARDASSFDVLRGLLGDAFDPGRHRCGVDVAFRLDPIAPRVALPPELLRWIDRDRAEEVVGINVSGLTYVRPDEARRDHGLTADYRATVIGLLERLLSKSTARIVLVPHVLVPSGHFESDRDACEAARAALGEKAADRVLVAPDLDAAEVKWLISRMDWFCGTRMHSTIAALSSGVPTSALAYSIKTRGVFETCGQEMHVAELRTLSTSAAVDAVWRSWEGRKDARARLSETLPRVLETADRQMDEIVETCRRLAAARRSQSAG